MDSSSSTDKPCSFFKIILSDIGLHSKLMIPRKFASKNEKILRDCIFLKAPCGSKWPVNLERCNEEVWLHNGWPEFAKFYGIRFGNLIVFEYRGSSTLGVVIFDKSATEIDYPLTCVANNSSKESTKLRKRVIEVDDYDLRPRKKTKAISAFGDAGVLIRKIKQQKSKGDGASEVGKTRAVASTESFESNNPFFTLNMYPSHLDGHHGAHVKSSFKDTYKTWKDNDQVILEVAGKTWKVDSKFKNNRCTFTNGWDKFTRDNSLAVGDVCVFELINPSRKLLQVFVFPAAKNPNKEKTQMKVTSEAEKPRVHASAKAFQSETPFFTITMQPSYVSGHFMLYVPTKFINRYISKERCNVSLQVSDGRAWSVRCSRGRARFSTGWRTFAEANNLAVGDVCVFQQVNHSENLLNVIIYRDE